MRLTNTLYALILFLFSFQTANAHIEPPVQLSPTSTTTTASYRMDCMSAEAQTDISINNVRARLTTGGDLWWNGAEGKYIVPKVEAGEPEVASIFASSVWIGGVDPGGNLKTACQTYGHFSGNDDFWPGPLSDFGETDPDICLDWDRFFRVMGSSVVAHRAAWIQAKAQGKTELDPDLIPDDIKGWPAQGNPFFFDVHGFELPSGNMGFNGLADFWDEGGAAGVYEPQFGDHPILDIRGCNSPLSAPDEMIFWIFNDGGGIHTNSNGDPILMEFQAYSFAFTSEDAINDMTFNKYKMINRAIEDIDDTYIGFWVDPDLGCYQDDYVGCDTTRNLAYTYNADALDGINTCDDCMVPTYCTDIPVVGIDFLRGPLNENGLQLEMSSFTYFDNAAFQPNPAMTNPQSAPEYYNYLSGRWRDGTPFTTGGTGYDPLSGEFTNFAFSSEPNDANGWSMCSENTAAGDFRTVQASGPFTLKPGAINELFQGAVWVPELEYPCPDMSRFFAADDLAQAAFDNCFDTYTGIKSLELDPLELANVQAFPNLFQTTSASGVNITNLPLRSQASIYDLHGRLLRQYPAGSFSDTLNWDGKDQRGNTIAEGMYLVQVVSEKKNLKVLKVFGV